MIEPAFICPHGVYAQRVMPDDNRWTVPCSECHKILDQAIKDGLEPGFVISPPNA